MADLEIKRKIARRLGLNEAEESFLNRTLNNKSPKHDSLTLAKGLTLEDGVNVDVGTSTGTQIGTSSSQKIGVFGATPVTQQSALTAKDSSTVDATYGTEESNVIQNNRTRIEELENKLKSYGWLP